MLKKSLLAAVVLGLSTTAVQANEFLATNYPVIFKR